MRFTSLSLACGFLAAALLLGGARLAVPQETKEPTQVEKKDPEKKAEPEIDKIDEEILRRADLSTNADALIEFLRKRTLPDKDRPAVELMVRRLNAANFAVRERATQDLIKRGVATLDVLRATQGPELELKRRIENVIQRIHENDVPPETGAAAVRVLAQGKAKDLVAVLLDYLPFTDDESVGEEIRSTLLKNAFVDGKAHPLLVAALTDRSAARRAAAGETLGRAAYAEHKDALRKLLADPNVLVRYRVARTLALARERAAVAVLIDALPGLPLGEAWRAEDLLLQLATKTPPPDVAMGNSTAAAKKCADAWRVWWKDNGAKADFGKLEEAPRMLGRTLIVLLDQREVVELGIDNRPRWELKNINFPLDAQLLGEDRVLVAEYNSNRVIERNLRGEVVWHRNVTGPLAAQRLPNGNTFIATATHLLEYDKEQNEVVNIPLSEDGNQTIMKAMKAPTGEIVIMRTDGQVVRYDARGNEKSSFPVSIGIKLFGGRIHVQANGRVLVPHNAEGKVAEYDVKGKIIWEVPFEQPIAAMRLPNGNTLITSMNPAIGAVEVDRAGVEVWSFRHSSNTRVTRAIRR
jgi:HEAT repeat protein